MALGSLYQGRHGMMKGGGRDQILQIRPYRSYDTLRDIDARKSAKFSELMVRDFERNVQQNIVIGIDLGQRDVWVHRPIQ